ncbi:MAG: hypothetical protein DHS20C02_03760 [Micavibrio sp.]|nr:MAG: hypothetical protein DHS20C02_03760 [Micavibrio sp.]
MSENIQNVRITVVRGEEETLRQWVGVLTDRLGMLNVSTACSRESLVAIKQPQGLVPIIDPTKVDELAAANDILILKDEAPSISSSDFLKALRERGHQTGVVFIRPPEGPTEARNFDGSVLDTRSTVVEGFDAKKIATAIQKVMEGALVDLKNIQTFSAAVTPEAASAAEVKQGQGAILVVDDERQIREVIVGMLEVQGYSVVSAAYGEEGRKIVEKGGISLVITDQEMFLKKQKPPILDPKVPELHGSDLIQAIRTMPDPICRTPIILSTGQGDEKLARIVEDLPHGKKPNSALTKPYNFTQISTVVSHWIGTPPVKCVAATAQVAQVVGHETLEK